MSCSTSSQLGVEALVSQQAQTLLKVFFDCRETGVYNLVSQGEVQESQLFQALTCDGKRPTLELVSYSKIKPLLAQRRKSRDSSVRATLMDIETMDIGKIERRRVPFYPGITLSHSNQDLWARICQYLQNTFLQNEVCDGCEEIAYYWYDALKILGCYLDLLFAKEEGKDVELLIEDCRNAIGILPFCVPLGWGASPRNHFVVLCA